MRHAHEFKSNFPKSDLAEPVTTVTAQEPTNAKDYLHEVDNDVRNLCFAWPDGKRAFFNYAFPMKVEFEPGSDKNIIQLNVSSYKVMLQGYRLKPLFLILLNHQPRFSQGN